MVRETMPKTARAVMASVRATRAQAVVQGLARVAKVSSAVGGLVRVPGTGTAMGTPPRARRVAISGAIAAVREIIARVFTGPPAGPRGHLGSDRPRRAWS